MRTIKSLSFEEMKELRHVINTSENVVLRRRCQCILYSFQGMQVNELTDMFKVDRRSIYNWMNRWHEGGIEALLDRPGRGLKPKLSLNSREQVDQVKQALSMYPDNNYQILEYVNTHIPRPISRDTLRRFVKKLLVV
jgi:transposase